MLLFVRVILPIVLLLAGVLAIALSVSLAVGVALVVLALFTVLTNFLIRLAISSQDDREREAAARERFVKTGRWSSR